MKLSKNLATAAAVCITAGILLQPAAAAPLMPQQGIGEAAIKAETVQYRRGYGWRGHHGGWRRGGGGGAAIIGGLAAGAIIGGAIASSQARAADSVAYCSQRFRSYDPGSGTYLGNDGLRHSCP